jgi:hypothetical protein
VRRKIPGLLHQAFIEFDHSGGGEFHFGYVHGDMDCRLTTRDGESAIEWSWEGNDEMAPCTGPRLGFAEG